MYQQNISKLILRKWGICLVCIMACSIEVMAQSDAITLAVKHIPF